MRIHRLHVNGFGRFSDLGLGPFERPVTVFHGLNEAGKSTLLEFIRRVFFGFPDGRSSSNPYPPLAGGRHGGSVTIVSDNGETVTVQRFQGTGGGPVRLTAEFGEPLPEGDLSRLLGQHSRDVFQNVFTFTLDELYSEKLLKDDSVNSQIYSAGVGAIMLPGALKRLNDDKNRLFLKGGSKHDIYDAAGEIDQVDVSLKGVANHAADYGRLMGELEKVRTSLQEAGKSRHSWRKQLDHQKLLRNAWDDWNGLNQAEEQLAELPAIDDFPVNGVSRLEKLEERIKTAQKEYDSANDEVDEVKAKAEAPVEHEAILNHSTDIRKLEQGRTSFDNSVRDLPKRTAEFEDHKNSLAATLKDLGPDWDEARLEKFDLSMAVREDISQYQERLQEAGEALKRCKANLDQDGNALKEAEEAKNKAEREISTSVKPNLNSNQIRQQRDLIRRAKSRLDMMSRANQRFYDLQSQLDSLKSAVSPAGGPGGSRMVAATSLVVGIALLLAGALLGGPVLPVGIVAGIALVGIAAYLFASGSSSPGAAAVSPLATPIRESLRKAENELKDLQSALEEDAASLGLETIDEPSLIDAEGSLDEEQARVDGWESLSKALDDAKDLTTERKRRTDKSRKNVNDAEAHRDAVRREWRHWLQTRGLRDNFLPETVVELRSKVDLGLTQLLNVRSWRQRIDAIRKDIDDYVAIAAPLASDFDDPFDRNESSTVAAAADTLIRLHNEVDEKIKGRTAAKGDLEENERRLKERKSDLRKAEQEMKELLQSANASGTEDFRKRAEIVGRRTDLEEKRRSTLGRLQGLSGPGEPLKALRKQLGDTDIQEIRDKERLVEEDIGKADVKISELSTEQGSIQTDLKNLIGEEESSKWRVERHRLLEEIRGHAREWVIRTIAENLLKKAQGKFEKERQPGVVRHAESFFKDITNGRYQTVFSPLDKSEIRVTDSAGVPRQPVQLSRGTREQLFLSLRFGLVRELGQRSERLPVIVDEALVNFDPERALRAAVAFTKLAETNQVLVFTCHPTIVNLFQNAAAKSGVQEPEVVPIG